MAVIVYANNSLGNYQVILPNGTIVGAGTTVNLTAVRGLRSLINTRTGDVPKAQQDGAFPGYNLLGVRVVQIDWLVFNPAVNTESAMANLTAGWQNVKDPTTVVLRVGDWLRQQANIGPTLPVSSLQIQLPGRTYPILVFGRPTKLDTPVDLNFQYGNVTAPSEFTCTDALIYDAVITSASCGLQNPTSGGTFPATFNYTFGASSGGSITLNNTGLYNTPPYLVVKGPCNNPAITNNGTGQYIRLNTTLTGSDTLAIDTQSGTVTLNGTANRNNIVDPTSTFFTLPPGSTSLQFSSSDSAAVTGTLTGYIVPAYSTI